MGCGMMTNPTMNAVAWGSDSESLHNFFSDVAATVF
ncbi:hypothetical protein PCO31010_02597 [Pandoraea commovens]|uniref:Uncharacterized protein n=1 Tax=Pandoraea commovens TaxID=2508289 RepID=A0A5E4VCJ4_9BURK|nr:hypothetical protein PCO31010_02597 [Pandoraea commovens]